MNTSINLATNKLTKIIAVLLLVVLSTPQLPAIDTTNSMLARQSLLNRTDTAKYRAARLPGLEFDEGTFIALFEQAALHRLRKKNNDLWTITDFLGKFNLIADSFIPVILSTALYRTNLPRFLTALNGNNTNVSIHFAPQEALTDRFGFVHDAVCKIDNKTGKAIIILNSTKFFYYDRETKRLAPKDNLPLAAQQTILHNITEVILEFSHPMANRAELCLEGKQPATKGYPPSERIFLSLARQIKIAKKTKGRIGYHIRKNTLTYLKNIFRQRHKNDPGHQFQLLAFVGFLMLNDEKDVNYNRLADTICLEGKCPLNIVLPYLDKAANKYSDLQEKTFYRILMKMKGTLQARYHLRGLLDELKAARASV